MINQPMNQPMPAGSGMMGQPAPSSSSKMPWVVLAVVVIVVLGVLGFLFRDKLGMNKQASNDLSGYQAVFLTNGQVYFGKISDVDSTYVTLHDIYYLQVNQPLQSPGQNGQPAAGQAAGQANAQQPQLSLVKLGNELHGPADLMHINRSQILFYEDLKASGKVAQAIVEYQKNGANANAAATSQQQQAPAQQAPAQQAPVK